MPPLRTKKARWAQELSVPAQKRGPWSNAEDENLRALVEEKGAGKWVQISDVLKTRTPKQCRERWHQNLKPELNHEPITDDEGKFIEDMVKQVGKKWAEIARMMENRSDNAVKNWWNGGENRRKREQARATEASQAHAYHHAMGHATYAQYQTDAHLFDHPTLPPLRGVHIPTPLTVPDRRHQIDPAEPSPLSAQAPSLISDAGTEHSAHHGFHSHRSSFNLPAPQLGSPIHMGRTHSNESHWPSPTERYPSYRVSHQDESNSVVRTEIVHDKRSLPSLDLLASGAMLHREAAAASTDPRRYAASVASRTGSASPVASSPGAQVSLPSFRELERRSAGPEEGRSRMSVNNICGP